MGQPIEITDTTVIDDVAVFDTDRSITGQNGAGFDSADAAAATPGFPARLAERVFAADPGIDHVYVASNEVVVRRRGGWDDAAIAKVADVIARFFVYYREDAA